MTNGRPCVVLILLCICAISSAVSTRGAEFVTVGRPSGRPLAGAGRAPSAGLAEAKAASINALVPHQRLRPASMLLLLRTDGCLAAHRLDNGSPLWTANTGGNVISANIVQRARRPLDRQDPFSLPFIMENDMLFTRRAHPRSMYEQPLQRRSSLEEDIDDNDMDEDEGGDWGGTLGSAPLTPRHPNYFMNLSTLIRRRHINVGETDIFVTASAEIMYFNGHTGHPTNGPISVAHLHVVRYNITIHAERWGEYKWEMNVSQFKLSEAVSRRDKSSTLTNEDPNSVVQMLQKQGDDVAHWYVVTRIPSMESVRASFGMKREVVGATQFVVHETTRKKYMLWNTVSSAPEWPSEVESGKTVIYAFVWLQESGSVHRVQLYRPHVPLARGTLYPITTWGHGTSKQNLPPLLSNKPWLIRSAGNVNPYVSTWEEDTDTDEREARELQESLMRCLWLQECAIDTEKRLNYSPNVLIGTNEPSQSLSVAFTLLSTTTKRTLFFVFQILCAIVSMTLAGFGMLLRPRLRNAWAQYDSLVDNMRCSYKSTTPNLVPKDASVRMAGSVPSPNDLTHTSAALCALANASPNCAIITPLNLDAGEHTQEQSVSANETQTSQDPGEAWWRNSNDDVEDDNSNTVVDSVTTGPSHVEMKNTPQLFQQHFDVLKRIGHGGEGKVFCVKHQVTGAMYAIKAIRIREEDKQRCVREAILHSSLDNPNVVRYFYSWIESVPLAVAEAHGILHEEGTECSISFLSEDSVDTKAYSELALSGSSLDVLFIQMEYFKSGTLADQFRNRESFVRLRNLEHLLQIAQGLHYIHEQEVVHRDLKPTNIFVTDAGVMKIGDFGLAKRRHTQLGWLRGGADEVSSSAILVDDERSIARGSPLYWSPEQQGGGSATAASDIFSLGLIAVEFYSLFITQHERIHTLGDARRAELSPTFEREFPEEASLVKKMLSHHPGNRPSVGEVIVVLRRAIEAAKVEDSDDILRPQKFGGKKETMELHADGTRIST